ncbi:tetratricopeptide repeat protein [Paenibacillus puerhi]|uniref:tetratricopeptide repeat protein n=1 Tax=Paenibacillus puerhi TaxID=2692622 RepID=UPI0013598CB3|nr:diadenylate cyclase [Paenibacillus puerhi]
MEAVHKQVFEHLESIIQRLDSRLNLKLFAIAGVDQAHQLKAFRIQRMLAKINDRETHIISEELSAPEDVFSKLGLVGGDSVVELRRLLDDPAHFSFSSLVPQPQSISESGSPSKSLSDTAGPDDSGDLAAPYEGDGTITPGSAGKDLFYAGRLCLQTEAADLQNITYMAAVQYADPETRFLFWEKSNVSFLRMILDYYFIDFYENHPDFESEFVVRTHHDGELVKKYREDSITFLQRMIRLFVGKIEDLLVSGTGLKSLSSLLPDLTSGAPQFYINNLLEKIDGISTRTYEGESPFGCMLLMNRDKLMNDRLVKYAIQFQSEDDRLSFDDARRIRKLLELTNTESDLYLIADPQGVYGIGEIDWSEVDDTLLIKVEFKGLSRYDIQLLTVHPKKGSESSMVSTDNKKTFKQTVNYEISPHPLLSVSFKRPVALDGGYTPERFRQLLKAQFDQPRLPLSEESIEKLQLLVQQAKDQQSGTMVVITELATAEAELKILRKQSTLIKPKEIKPAFIGYLTSIDGAIYLDTSGACHAIGVILDGLAQEHQGDASRGARYHSAYRYQEKLRLDKNGAKPCVIAIISEDGTVDLIPELHNEASVRQLVTEYVDYIKEHHELTQDMLTDFEERLNLISEGLIDHFQYFIIGDVFFEKQQYKNAHRYYSKGLELCGKFYVTYNRAQALSLFRYVRDDKEELSAEEKTEAYKEVARYFDTIIDTAQASDLISNDYNCRGNALHRIGLKADEEEKHRYFDQALQDFNQAISMRKNIDAPTYRNRSYLYITMGKRTEALEDLITAELTKSQESRLPIIMQIVKQDLSYFHKAISIYNHKKTKKRDSEVLRKALMEYGASLELDDDETAAALEELSSEGHTINKTDTAGE